MKLTTIDRASLVLTKDRVLAALQTLETELGVKFSYGGGTFEAFGTRGQIKLGVEVADCGGGKSSEQVDFEAHAFLYGLKPEWYGARFNMGGAAYRLMALNHGSPKYRLSIERADGKRFKATLEGVKSALEIEVATGRLVA